MPEEEIKTLSPSTFQIGYRSKGPGTTGPFCSGSILGTGPNSCRAMRTSSDPRVVRCLGVLGNQLLWGPFGCNEDPAMNAAVLV